MTDREPLRVGPLVLEWREDRRDDDNRRLLSGYVLPGTTWAICLDVKAWVVAAGGQKLGVRWSALDNAASDLLAWLTETGYLAQYRSRRRLLATMLAMKAAELHHDAFQAELLGLRDRSDRSSRRAAKYARWAEMLRAE
jgi:tRNA isopentenyl-2-thiomethyl-A-37 hydroxylase MiaE